MAKPQPAQYKRQHYVPQFLLRKFVRSSPPLAAVGGASLQAARTQDAGEVATAHIGVVIAWISTRPMVVPNCRPTSRGHRGRVAGQA